MNKMLSLALPLLWGFTACAHQPDTFSGAAPQHEVLPIGTTYHRVYKNCDGDTGRDQPNMPITCSAQENDRPIALEKRLRQMFPGHLIIGGEEGINAWMVQEYRASACEPLSPDIEETAVKALASFSCHIVK